MYSSVFPSTVAHISKTRVYLTLHEVTKSPLKGLDKISLFLINKCFFFLVDHRRKMKINSKHV